MSFFKFASVIAGFVALTVSPISAQNLLTRIAFGSCADEELPQPIWQAVLGYGPELFVFAGDNVYGDVRDGKGVAESKLIESLGHAYARAAEVPGYKALRSTVPHLATWDDHDFGKNDAGADFADKREAQELFLRFWNIPADDPRSHRDGIYHSENFGPANQRVQVILLDTRFFRSPLKSTDEHNAAGKERYLPDESADKTMLGETQWTWLAERLREPAQVRIIVSSIQVVADGHGWERWGNFPRERRRLYDLIGETGAQGVIFVSGDRHLGGIYREERGTPYTMHDVTGSGINKFFAGADEAGPNRIGAVYSNPNFGTIDIDWPAGEVRLSVRDETGQPVRSHLIKFSDLK